MVPRHKRENASVKSHQYDYLNKNRIVASDDNNIDLYIVCIDGENSIWSHHLDK